MSAHPEGTFSDVSGGYALEPAELDAIVGFLGDARSELTDDVRSLSVSPDAGRSTDEVAKAFGALSTAGGALAERVGVISSTLADNVARYREAEERVATTFRADGLQP